jgi:predicted dienelactone hydrolase
VLAPEHNERFDGALTGFWEELIDRPVDIHRTIDEAELLAMPGAPLDGMLDMEHIAVVGHSYGGFARVRQRSARPRLAQVGGPPTPTTT